MGIIQKVLAGSADKLGVTIITDGNADLNTAVDKFAGWVGTIAGVIVFFYLVYGGFLYLTAGGNAEQTKKGGQAILNAIIGLIIIILAYAITRGIVKLLSPGTV